MTLKKQKRMNFRGCQRSIWTSLTALVSLVMPVAGGYAQTTPAAIASAKHSAKAPAEGGDQSIRPFRINFPQNALADLKRRLAVTQWPERETVTDRSQGVQLATMKALVGYWQSSYDWRKVEARLNAVPQFVTTIDGLDIHFIHVRSKHPNALCRSSSRTDGPDRSLKSSRSLARSQILRPMVETRKTLLM